jgi:hypothetical protein
MLAGPFTVLTIPADSATAVADPEKSATATTAIGKKSLT